MPLYEQFLALSPQRRTSFIERATTEPALRAAITPSAVQERMIVLSAMDGGAAAYNLSWAGRIRGPLDLDALDQAYERLQLRHEQLTRRFVHHNDTLLSLPAAPEQVPPMVRTGLSDEAARDADTERRALLAARTPMTVLGGPLCRLQIIEHAAEDHVILLDIHHAVADGRSLEVVHRDLTQCYRDALASRETIWPPAQATYDDYVAAELEAAANGQTSSSLNRVLARMRNAPAKLSLPSDHTRPLIQDFTGNTVVRPLSLTAVEALRTSSTRTGRTPFVVGLSVFAEVMRRYSGDDDLVIGVPVLGRPTAQYDDVVGMFVNTVPVRVDLAGTTTMEGSADRTYEAWMSTLEDHLVPLDAVVARSGQERDLSHSPLFQVTFAHSDSLPGAGSRWEGLECEPVKVSSDSAKFDLSFTLHDGGGTDVGLEVEYATAVFDDGTAVRVIQLFEHLLIDLADAPEADPRSRFHLLPGALPHDVSWSTATVDQPWEDPKNSLELISRAAQRFGDAVAVRDASTCLNYRELLEAASKLTRRIIGLGLGPGDRVGVMLQRTPNMVSTLLGVWGASCSYVPLDPSYPRERLLFMVDDARCRIVVVDNLADAPEGIDNEVEVLGLADAGPITAQPLSHDLPGVDTPAESEAYLLYTSGSTGVPKGVSIPHRAVLAMVHASWQVFGTAPLRSSLAATSISFDVFTVELYPTLALGGTVHLAESLLDVPDYAGPPTFTAGVPTLLGAALDIGSLDVTGMVVAAGGEELRSGLVEHLLSAGAHQVVNIYGPSEDCTYSTAAVATPGEIPPIGWSVPGSGAQLLDASGFAVPPGAVGELYLTGAGLADGYSDRPSLTADRFTPDPYSTEGGARRYRTGDLARLRTDGALVYLGRVDRQVKVNGMRIELGEVEAALGALPDVSACVVVVQRGEDSARLAAAVVSDRNLIPSKLRRELTQRLPRHLVPTVLVQLDALPRLPNSKIDVDAVLRCLPAFERVSPVGVNAAASRSEPAGIKGIVRSCWIQLLPGSSTDGDLFAEGGTSMTALRLALRLSDRVGVSITLADVFAARTVLGLVSLLETRLSSNTAHRVVDDVHSTDEEIALSREQLSIWWLEQTQDVGATYVIPAGWRISGKLDVEALAAAVEALQWRHPLLRHRLDPDAAYPSTRPADPIALRIDHEPSPVRTTERFEAFAATPFDIEGGPLLNMELWYEGPETHVLVLKVHHLIADGWSMGVIDDEISTLYSKALTDASIVRATARRDAVPPVRIIPNDDVQIQQAVAKRAGRLRGAPTVLSLGSRRRPGQTSFAGTSIVEELDVDAASALDHLCERFAITPFAVGSFVQALTLMATTTERDVLIGTPVAGRNHPSLERAVGMFVSTAVLRIDARQDPTIDELLPAHAGEIIEATQDVVPLEALVDAISPTRAPGVNPLFQVLFAYDDAGPGGLVLQGMNVEPLSTEGTTAKFDLFVTLDVSGPNRSLVLEHATDVISDSEARLFAARFGQIAIAAAKDPTRTVSQVLAAKEVLS